MQFTQINAIKWADDKGRQGYTLFALGVDGHIYKSMPQMRNPQHRGWLQPRVTAMKHTEYVCKGGHDLPGCMFCDGGLFSCTACNGFEGTLPTDCPATPMTDQQTEAVYAGKLDYREGRGWIEPDGTGRSMGDSAIYAAIVRSRRECTCP